MKNSIKCSLVICCSLVYSFSCRRKCPCNPASVPIQMVSFLKSEIDTIIVKRFTKGTNFQILQDSVLVDNSNCYYIQRGFDTIELATKSLIGHIKSNFDYEIDIPSLNRVSKISDIVEIQIEGSCGKCSNSIVKFVMKDQTYYNDRIFIEK